MYARADLEAAAARLLERERRAYAERRPRAAALAGGDAPGFLARVPLHWMTDWPMPFPMVVERAQGARLVDVDGHELVDFCLGDTGAMFGHGPAPVVAALARAATTGLTTMLPSAEAAAVGRLLAERFRLPRWQVATTASDANRFAIRVARAATGRPKVLVFDGCYHGAVEDTLVDLVDGRTVARGSLLGQVRDTGLTTVAVPFNDEAALRAALAAHDVACVLAEPVMTNCGMILPRPGFLAALRRATRDAGTLLLIDETHTLSSGLGGYAAVHGLDPDLLVVGKAVGGGIPVAVWGMTEDVAARLAAAAARRADAHGHSGIGTTLSGSALQLACLRACLEEIQTPATYARMNALADRIAAGFAAALAAHRLPWHVGRVGARIEVVFAPEPVVDAVGARAAASAPVEAAVHLAMLNRGHLLTPFHNMVLACPALDDRDADALVAAYDAVLSNLVAAAGR